MSQLDRIPRGKLTPHPCPAASSPLLPPRPLGFRAALGVIGAMRERAPSPRKKEELDSLVEIALTGSKEERLEISRYLSMHMALSQETQTREPLAEVQRALLSYLSHAFGASEQRPTIADQQLVKKAVAAALAEGDTQMADSIEKWLGRMLSPQQSAELANSITSQSPWSGLVLPRVRVPPA